MRWSHELTIKSSCKYTFSLNLWMNEWHRNLIFTGELLFFFHIELIKMLKMVNALGINNDHALNPINEPLINVW